MVVSMGWMHFPSHDQSSWAHSLEVLKKEERTEKEERKQRLQCGRVKGEHLGVEFQ